MFGRKKPPNTYRAETRFNGTTYGWALTYPGRKWPDEWGYDLATENEALDSVRKEINRHMAETNYKKKVLTVQPHLATS